MAVFAPGDSPPDDGSGAGMDPGMWARLMGYINPIGSAQADTLAQGPNPLANPRHPGAIRRLAGQPGGSAAIRHPADKPGDGEPGQYESTRRPSVFERRTYRARRLRYALSRCEYARPRRCSVRSDSSGNGWRRRKLGRRRREQPYALATGSSSDGAAPKRHAVVSWRQQSAALARVHSDAAASARRCAGRDSSSRASCSGD